MKQIAFVLILALWFATGCSESKVESSRRFTSEFAEAIKKADPKLKVEVTADLELKVTTQDGHQNTAYLNNAYDLYLKDPGGKADLLQHYIAANLELAHEKNDKTDRTRVVPVIKNRSWVKEIAQSAVVRQAKKPSELVVEDFVSDLVVVYAQDSATGIRFLTADHLQSAGIERATLRQLACDNLMRLVPEMQQHGTNGTYMITADGTYEASLLLFDSIWNGTNLNVRGDIVVAVPTRDMLLVTGSQDADGIKRIRRLVKQASGSSAYALSETLLVYRNGKFEEFRGSN